MITCEQCFAKTDAFKISYMNCPYTHQRCEYCREAILQRFAKKIIENSEDIDPEVYQTIDDHFWELI